MVFVYDGCDVGVNAFGECLVVVALLKGLTG